MINKNWPIKANLPPENEWNGYACCLIDSSHGIYIPQIFSQNEKNDFYGYSQDDIDILLIGPEHEKYNEAWNNVYVYAFLYDIEGNKWTLWLDGDLWAVSEELMTDQEYLNFFGKRRG
jgi:hypothetical protein